jgi:hypothetical protein
MSESCRYVSWHDLRHFNLVLNLMKPAIRQRVPEIGGRQHPLSRQQRELAPGAHAPPSNNLPYQNLINHVPPALTRAVRSQ